LFRIPKADSSVAAVDGPTERLPVGLRRRAQVVLTADSLFRHLLRHEPLHL
uniref:Cytochrome P450 n=1 Tax=Haemonchus placei TaxID=6290 RepID=A0A0N4WPA2_HAEPC